MHAAHEVRVLKRPAFGCCWKEVLLLVSVCACLGYNNGATIVILSNFFTDWSPLALGCISILDEIGFLAALPSWFAAVPNLARHGFRCAACMHILSVVLLMTTLPSDGSLMRGLACSARLLWGFAMAMELLWVVTLFSASAKCETCVFRAVWLLFAGLSCRVGNFLGACAMSVVLAVGSRDTSALVFLLELFVLLLVWLIWESADKGAVSVADFHDQMQREWLPYKRNFLRNSTLARALFCHFVVVDSLVTGLLAGLHVLWFTCLTSLWNLDHLAVTLSWILAVVLPSAAGTTIALVAIDKRNWLCDPDGALSCLVQAVMCVAIALVFALLTLGIAYARIMGLTSSTRHIETNSIDAWFCLAVLSMFSLHLLYFIGLPTVSGLTLQVLPEVCTHVGALVAFITPLVACYALGGSIAWLVLEVRTSLDEAEQAQRDASLWTLGILLLFAAAAAAMLFNSLSKALSPGETEQEEPVGHSDMPGASGHETEQGVKLIQAAHVEEQGNGLQSKSAELRKESGSHPERSESAPADGSMSNATSKVSSGMEEPEARLLLQALHTSGSQNASSPASSMLEPNVRSKGRGKKGRKKTVALPRQEEKLERAACAGVDELGHGDDLDSSNRHTLREPGAQEVALEDVPLQLAAGAEEGEMALDTGDAHSGELHPPWPSTSGRNASFSDETAAIGEIGRMECMTDSQLADQQCQSSLHVAAPGKASDSILQPTVAEQDGSNLSRCNAEVAGDTLSHCHKVQEADAVLLEFVNIARNKGDGSTQDSWKVDNGASEEGRNCHDVDETTSDTPEAFHAIQDEKDKCTQDSCNANASATEACSKCHEVDETTSEPPPTPNSCNADIGATETDGNCQETSETPEALHSIQDDEDGSTLDNCDADISATGSCGSCHEVDDATSETPEARHSIQDEEDESTLDSCDADIGATATGGNYHEVGETTSETPEAFHAVQDEEDECTQDGWNADIGATGSCGSCHEVDDATPETPEARHSIQDEEDERTLISCDADIGATATGGNYDEVDEATSVTPEALHSIQDEEDGLAVWKEIPDKQGPPTKSTEECQLEPSGEDGSVQGEALGLHNALPLHPCAEVEARLGKPRWQARFSGRSLDDAYVGSPDSMEHRGQDRIGAVRPVTSADVAHDVNARPSCRNEDADDCEHMPSSELAELRHIRDIHKAKLPFRPCGNHPPEIDKGGLSFISHIQQTMLEMRE